MPAPKEDYVFWLLILKQSIVAYNTNTTLALYRDSLASRSSDKVAMLKTSGKLFAIWSVLISFIVFIAWQYIA